VRHSYFGRRLGRDTNARKALLNNLASSLIEKGSVTTTLAKAKFARPYVEKIITRSKRKNDLRTARILASHLTDKAFANLRSNLGPGFASRNGGYTRIIKLNQRAGDAAPMARLELLKVDKPPEKTKEDKRPVKKKVKNEKP
jgi:large subunit ribosomal protein L17